MLLEACSLGVLARSFWGSWGVLGGPLGPLCSPLGLLLAPLGMPWGTLGVLGGTLRPEWGPGGRLGGAMGDEVRSDRENTGDLSCLGAGWLTGWLAGWLDRKFSGLETDGVEAPPSDSPQI